MESYLRALQTELHELTSLDRSEETANDTFDTEARNPFIKLKNGASLCENWRKRKNSVAKIFSTLINNLEFRA